VVPPCRLSLPHVQKLSADKSLADKGLVVWAVNDQETKPVVETFLKQNNYTFTVLMDDSSGGPQGLLCLRDSDHHPSWAAMER